jgi:Bacterial extracellular solute-binding protein
MRRGLNAATACLLAVLGGLVQGPSRAAEIVVLTNMGVVSAVRDLAPAFERASGHKVIISFELGNAMMQKINSNAPADVVTQTPEVIDDLIKQGKVVGERVDFARAGIGVAVKAGAPKPDIGSADAFKRSMLAAKSIAYSRAGASGVYVAKLLQRLGIADELKDKIKLVDGVPVAELERRDRDRHAADQRHSARCRHRLRRPAAIGATGLRRVRRRDSGGFEGTRSGAGHGKVHGRARGRPAHSQERHGAGHTLTATHLHNKCSAPAACRAHRRGEGQSAGPAGAIGLGFAVFR